MTVVFGIWLGFEGALRCLGLQWYGYIALDIFPCIACVKVWVVGCIVNCHFRHGMQGFGCFGIDYFTAYMYGNEYHHRY